LPHPAGPSNLQSMPTQALHFRSFCVVTTLAMLLAPCLPAFGQGIGAGKTRRDAGLKPLPEASPRPKPSLSTDVKLPWPRLDPGAVLCRTANDLAQHASAMQIRAAGGGAGTLARPDCHIVTAPTPVDIVTREGAGQTEVRLRRRTASASEGETGWTDVWLPDRAP
jgi:hypothetical protein